jgi:hypothetical protein
VLLRCLSLFLKRVPLVLRQNSVTFELISKITLLLTLFFALAWLSPSSSRGRLTGTSSQALIVNFLPPRCVFERSC